MYPAEKSRELTMQNRSEAFEIEGEAIDVGDELNLILHGASLLDSNCVSRCQIWRHSA